MKNQLAILSVSAISLAFGLALSSSAQAQPLPRTGICSQPGVIVQDGKLKTFKSSVVVNLTTSEMSVGSTIGAGSATEWSKSAFAKVSTPVRGFTTYTLVTEAGDKIEATFPDEAAKEDGPISAMASIQFNDSPSVQIDCSLGSY